METIKSSTDISELFAKGKRIKTPFVTFIVGKHSPEKSSRDDERHGPSGRVAFIAGKKLGNAVWRNAAKRRMRALCRELEGPWHGYDVVFLAKSNICQASYSKVLKTCEEALRRLGASEEGRKVGEGSQDH
ncbi:ribonuclease P protein component [uncultured Adlercreutzia sp.]|uniref:ribonuclease P protein component n=1 Tax=uncultured Adlercreutzia sp. TaxID=875803 RepID=UPI0026380E48|nr:ribonuclease P protein component [uncultured Adlercreutzia sp.]MCI9261389.1 ribonuclease P protein component [Eggerthellaceae bacterium]MEE0705849.1 ribonuclease P protein component [Adlercreutzia sp.]